MSSNVFCQRSMPAAILLETSRFMAPSSSSPWCAAAAFPILLASPLVDSLQLASSALLLLLLALLVLQMK